MGRLRRRRFVVVARNVYRYEVLGPFTYVEAARETIRFWDRYRASQYRHNPVTIQVHELPFELDS